jgi:hypothetical protein
MGGLAAALIVLGALLAEYKYFLNGSSIYHINSLASSTLAFIKLTIDNFRNLDFYPQYWCNLIYTGGPIHTGLSVYNPLLILVAPFAKFSDALIAYGIVIRILAGGGMLLLLRRMNISRAAAIACALVYMYNPWYASLGQDPQFGSIVALAPWVLLCLEKMAQDLNHMGRCIWDSLLLALALTLSFLATNIQTHTFLLLLAVFPFAVLRIAPPGVFSQPAGIKKSLAFLCLVGLGIGLHLGMIVFELVPTYKSLAVSDRVVSGEGVKVLLYSFILLGSGLVIKWLLTQRLWGLSLLAGLVLAWGLSYAGEHISWQNLFIANYTQKMTAEAFEFRFQHMGHIFTALQFGFLVLALLIPGLNRSKRNELWFLALAITTLHWLCLQPHLLAHIPLVGSSLAQILTGAATKYNLRFLFIPLLGLCLGMGRSLDFIGSRLKALFQKDGRQRRLGLGLAAGILLGLFCLEAAYVYFNRTVFTQALPLLNASIPENRFLAGMRPGERTLGISEKVHTNKKRVLEARALPRWLMPVYFGANTLSKVGINAVPKETRRFYRIAVPEYFGASPQKPLNPMLNFAGVKYLFSIPNLATQPHLRLVKKGLEYHIYQNQAAFPRLLLLAHTTSRPNGKAIAWLKNLTEKELRTTAYLPPGRIVALENDGLNQITSANAQDFASNLGKVHFITYGNELIEVGCDIQQECLLVLTDTFFKGWKAWAEGKPVEIIRTDYAFRGMKLKPGKYTLVLKFAPDSYYLALIISALTLAVVLGGLICLYLFFPGQTKPGHQ